MAKKYRLTSNAFTAKSVAMKPSCATAMRPPVTVQVDISSITQNTGVQRLTGQVSPRPQRRCLGCKLSNLHQAIRAEAVTRPDATPTGSPRPG